MEQKKKQRLSTVCTLVARTRTVFCRGRLSGPLYSFFLMCTKVNLSSSNSPSSPFARYSSFFFRFCSFLFSCRCCGTVLVSCTSTPTVLVVRTATPCLANPRAHVRTWPDTLTPTHPHTHTNAPRSPCTSSPVPFASTAMCRIHSPYPRACTHSAASARTKPTNRATLSPHSPSLQLHTDRVIPSIHLCRPPLIPFSQTYPVPIHATVDKGAAVRVLSRFQSSSPLDDPACAVELPRLVQHVRASRLLNVLAGESSPCPRTESE